MSNMMSKLMSNMMSKIMFSVRLLCRSGSLEQSEEDCISNRLNRAFHGGVVCAPS